MIVLDQGKIVARGRHSALLAQGGVYTDLYRTQLDTDITSQRPKVEIQPEAAS